MMDVRDLEAGTSLLGQYAIKQRLGIGGFGVVYKAEQVSTGQQVAIKFLLKHGMDSASQQSDHEARFEREMKLLAKLNHPHIVKLIDFGVFHEHRFMALEFVDGEELAEQLKRQGGLDGVTARRVMIQTLEGLAFAHNIGVVHRDLKPQNIMLTGPGRRQHAKLLDFGIANLTDERRGEDWRTITRAGMLFGTPCYMSPEQIRSQEIAPTSDIYAMGLILLECLTGVVAVNGDSPMEICFKQLTEEVVIPPAVRGGPFGQVIEKAIAKDPAQRFQNCEAMLEALERVEPENSSLMTTGPVPNADELAHAQTGRLDGFNPAEMPQSPFSQVALGPALHTTIQVAKSSPWAWFAVFSLALACAAGVAVWFALGSTSDSASGATDEAAAPAKADAPPPSEPAPVAKQRPLEDSVNAARAPIQAASEAGMVAIEAPAEVRWSVRSTPVSTVLIDGQEVCAATPCELQRTPDQAPLAAIVRAEGYVDAPITLSAAGGQVEVTLAEKPRQHRRRRRAASSETPSGPSIPEFD